MVQPLAHFLPVFLSQTIGKKKKVNKMSRSNHGRNGWSEGNNPSGKAANGTGTGGQDWVSITGVPIVLTLGYQRR
jgi:hypothetical protein